MWLKHYGILRRSGRYPWGSGEDPQRSKDIISINDHLKGKGYTEKEIAEKLGIKLYDKEFIVKLLWIPYLFICQSYEWLFVWCY